MILKFSAQERSIFCPTRERERKKRKCGKEGGRGGGVLEEYERGNLRAEGGDR